VRPVLLPVVRVARSRGAWLAAAAWSALVLAAAWRERSHGAVHGAAQALETYASIGVPFVVYALVGAAVAPEELAGSGRPLVRLGASPVRVATATVVIAMAASAALSGLLGGATVAWAHGSADPPLQDDALLTLGVGALAGAAYAAYFLVGSALVARGWGRAALLVLDYAVGTDDGLGALLTPRAHLRNLLGGDAPFDALPSESLVALASLASAGAVLAIWRASRVRV
jgi:hypothetical protein